MRKTSALTAALLAALLAPARGRGGEPPAPDFARGRRADPDFNLSFELTVPRGGLAAPGLLVAAGSAKGYAFARLGPGRSFELGSVPAGGKTPRAGARLPAAPAGGRIECLLKFRAASGGFIALVAGGRELARAGLPELPGPFRLALAGGGGLKVRGYQKIDRSEPVLFTDDFTRRAAGLGAWKADRPGAWRINADPHPETSASPFALECARSGKPAMVRAGRGFWDDYRARVAVNVLASPGAAGLALGLREDGGGYLLRLAVEGRGSGGAGRAELVHLLPGGGERVLAARRLAGSPGAWYELELASAGGELRAWVDGAELAAISGRSDLVGGRVGLWSSGAAPVRYDDVEVRALSLAPGEFRAGGAKLDLARRRWRRPAPSLPSYFMRDRTMRGWARLGEEYYAASGGYWHRARLGGAQEIAWRASGAPLDGGQLVLALAGDGRDFASGYRLVADLGAGGAGGAIFSVFERDRRAAGRLLPLGGAGLERISFSREAGRLVVRVGARVVLSARDTLKLASGQAGARALGGWRLQSRQLSTCGASLLDEVFSRAPVEWRAATGRWEVSSRWKCDPEYTWLLGRSRRRLARLDLKRPVRGGFKLDLHFAVPMSERPAPFYDFPTNLSVSLSPDPRNPAAGYVLAFGGIDLASRILRKGRVAASTGSLVRRDARAAGGGAGIHSHWFHLRVERRGPRLVFYGDGEKLGEFSDPEPIKGADHLSLWTRGDNGVTLARFRLEAEKPLGARRSPFLAGKPARPAALPAELRHFANRDGPEGARLSAAKEPVGRVLSLTNVNAGGTFAAAWAPPGGIDLAGKGWLSFRWRTSPGARVNLYLVRGGVFHRLRLTGPAARVGGRYNLRALGEVPGARAGTGKWQRFSCDLGALLAAAGPTLKDLEVDEIRIGNYEVEDFALLEGLAGNRAGERVEIAGWKLGGDVPPGAGKTVTLALDVAAAIKEKRRLTNAARPDPRTMYVIAGDRRIKYDGIALRYDAFSGRLTFSARAAGHAFQTGDNGVFLGYNGFSRRNLDDSAKFAVTFDPKLDKRPPTLPRLVEPAPLEFQDFERSLGSWRSFAGLDGARLVLDEARAAHGRRCLLAENRRCGGMLAAAARSRPFDVKRYPTLGFDYCIEPGTRVNLLLFTAGNRHEIELTDSRGGADRLGRVAGAAADGRWRRADLDLGEALRHRRRSIVRRIGLADLGPGSSTTTSAYRIDNWTLLPAVNGARPVSFRWRADDESGIAGYSAVLDRAAGTVPEKRVTTGKGELPAAGGLAAGTWYLHVRARDRAGNWGASAHWRFHVGHHADRVPPRVASVRPAAGRSACPRRIEVLFEEKGSGLSAHDVELTVGGRTFRPGDPGVCFYPGEGKLTLEMARFGGGPRAAPGELKCSVRAADYAGNRMAKSFRWTWKLDLSRDSVVPPAPRVVYLPSERLVFEDFERGQGTFANWRRGLAYRVAARAPGGAGLGRWHLATGGRRLHDMNKEVQLWPRAFDPERYSYLAFDYRVTARTSFSFLLEINNQQRQLDFARLSGGRASPLGRLPQPVRDGAWHRLEVDLRALRAHLPARPDGRMAVIQKFLALFHTRQGADLDNFVLGSMRGRDPEFIWEAPAVPSGIAGYSWLLDAKPGTVPPEKARGAGPRAAFRKLMPGTHYFHLRARSGAGRWGRTAHVKIVIEKNR